MVEENLKHITPSASVDRKTGIISVGDTVDEGHEIGYALLSDIVNDKDHTVIIQEAVQIKNGPIENTFAFIPEKMNELGCDAISFYNGEHDIPEFVDGEVKNNLSQPYVNLFHEFTHAWHSMMGIYNPSRKKIDYEGANGKTYHDASQEEVDTMGFSGKYAINENNFRREHNLPLRNNYDPLP